MNAADPDAGSAEDASGASEGGWLELSPTAAERLGLADGTDGAPWRAHLAGDWRYLSTAYYALLDAELAGARAVPSPADALDAAVAPIALARAQASGVPCAGGAMATDRFPPPPFLAIPVNPFQRGSELVLDEAALAARRSGLTYNGNYAVLCLPLPPDARVDRLRVVLGACQDDVQGGVAEMARSVAAALRLPLFRMRVIVDAESVRFAGTEPLPWRELNGAERNAVAAAGAWVTP